MTAGLAATAAGTLVVAALTAHTAVNAGRWLRRLPAEPDPAGDPAGGTPADPDPAGDRAGGTPSGPDRPAERVAVLLPLRNEADRVAPCLRALLAQRGGPELDIVLLDDGSTDGTAEVVRRVAAEERAAGSPRPRLVTGAPLPAGWLGKPYACQQLAGHADPAATVLVFVDADVLLAPRAVAAAVAGLRRADVTLLSPYPRIVAETAGERLVQPLLQWLWLTFLPLRAMERSRRAALAAAGGQFLVVDRAGYAAAGCHAAVRDRILEDIELARAVKRSGGRIALADASALASCRMYGSWAQLRDGYTKSLWASFGSPVSAAAVLAALLALYTAPPLLAVAAALAGAVPVALLALAGYLLGVAGRVLSARRTGGRCWPDALAHPVSVALLGWLTFRSYHLRRARRLSWRGRPVR
ncbi:glycosyltransferase family 2 protein [Plantactinospora sp. KBS50]|uniref:glycosyltransferase n=1 Tax=Plantactinospora sp. KBS50 TaxID=2024580 RepID=UPI000BAB12E4|nr:glycosyltransferase family 2 protein [Plantactinospora sp. KBS50]ASW57864.1 glycosyl transferase [Plantactinospora sp. KBS50]